MAKGQKVDAEDMKWGDGNNKTLKVLRRFCQILWLQQEVVWMKNVATIFPTFKVDSWMAAVNGPVVRHILTSGRREGKKNI